MDPWTGAEPCADFVDVPWSVYADHPMWVPPLLVERRQHLSRRNPYLAQADQSGRLRPDIHALNASVTRLLERSSTGRAFAEQSDAVADRLADTNWSETGPY